MYISDCTEGELYDEDDYVAEADWGESWPSFDNFDTAVSNLREKSNGLVQLISDMCDVEAKYSKRMRDLATSHLKTYQKTHSKVSHHKHAERTKHIAMMKVLQET